MPRNILLRYISDKGRPPMRNALALLCVFALIAGCSEPPPPNPAPAAPPPPPAATPAVPAAPANVPEAPKPDPDKQLAASVKKALDSNAKLNAQGVDVTAKAGV